MPLDDHEQRILEEIERQFYEQDPALARAVNKIDRPARFGVRLPLVGLALGIVIVLVAFTRQTYVAFAGFVLMVASATALIHSLRSRGLGAGAESGDEEDDQKWWAPPFGRD